MRLTTDQYQADRSRMKAYVAARIPEEGIEVVLAEGEGGDVCVQFDPVPDDDGQLDLHWETNCKEAVGLREIYDHFRRLEVAVEEWRLEIHFDSRATTRVSQAGRTRPGAVQLPQPLEDRLYTVREAAEVYFQGKVSPREINTLFHKRTVRGFRVGAKILLYESSLDEYRQVHENRKLPAEQPEALGPIPEPSQRPETDRRTRRGAGLPQIRLKRLPSP